MHGWQKVLLWVFILVGCAGIGAFIASRSNLFPPEVRSPPPTPSESPSPSIEPPVRWKLTMTSRTSHAYHVGGSCTSDWRMRARIRVTPDGEATGGGVAHLLPGARCDFPTAQVQAETVVIRIGGVRSGGRLELIFGRKEVGPPGAQDLGGFLRTLPAMRPSIRERPGATLRDTTRVEEPEDEIHVAATTFELTR